MPSGKRQSVLIFCVSPIKELYLEPIEHYDPNLIYVFKSEKDGPLTKIENDIYSKSTLKCNSIKEIVIDTNDYISVLAELTDHVKQLESEFENVDFFLNISSGTHEFTAAAMFISMAKKNAIAFSVDVTDYGIKECEIRDFIERLSPTVNIPEMIKPNDNKVPDDELIGFLIILDDFSVDTRYPKHADIILELKNRGLWTHNPRKKSSGDRTPLEKKEEMYLIRHYFKPAIENAWIADNKKKIEFTEQGKTMLKIYRPKELERELQENKRIETFECENVHLCSSCEESTDLRKMHNILELNISSGSNDIQSDKVGGPVTKHKDNLVEFEHKGKKYRFRVGME